MLFMIKAGILGGGQLGRMLLQEAINFPVETFVLENDEHCPAAYLCGHFVKGDIRDFDAVYHFGKGLDAITIEIENVNIEALEKLEQEGKKIFPKPSVLKTIKNKIRQKEYYKQHQIPSPEFIITNTLSELEDAYTFLPAVHKLGEGGYDGRGVQLLDKKEFILSKQLLRSGTSIGANVEEAIAAQSRKDFISKMSIASKEAREKRFGCGY